MLPVFESGCLQQSFLEFSEQLSSFPAHQVPLTLVVRVAIPLTLLAQVVGAPVPVHEAVRPAAIHVRADVQVEVVVAVVPAAHSGPLALGISVAVPLPYNAGSVLRAEVPGKFQCRRIEIAYGRAKQNYPNCMPVHPVGGIKSERIAM